MVSKSRSGSGFKSIKDGGGMHAKKGISKSENLGPLMRKHRDLEEALYPFTSSIDMVFEDMDFTVEEFSDIVGADLQELLDAIDEAIKIR